MTIKKFTMAIACAVVSMMAVDANADIVAASYDFAGASAAQTSGELTATDFTAGDFTSGTGGHGFSASEHVFARTEATGTVTGDGDTLAAAIAADSYYGFTLTNNLGVDRNLDTVEFNYWFTSGFNGGDFRIFALSSRAGFTDGAEHGFGQVLNNSRPTAADQLLEVIDISSLGTLASGDSVDFRFYFVDNSTAGGRIHRLDDVTVTVEAVSVPEPSSIALLGLGALAFIGRRRR